MNALLLFAAGVVWPTLVVLNWRKHWISDRTMSLVAMAISLGFFIFAFVG